MRYVHRNNVFTAIRPTNQKSQKEMGLATTWSKPLQHSGNVMEPLIYRLEVTRGDHDYKSDL